LVLRVGDSDDGRLAPALATARHSWPELGRIFQFCRSGAPISFCISGLTVVGTGILRAGTSRGAEAVVCAVAAATAMAANPSAIVFVRRELTIVRLISLVAPTQCDRLGLDSATFGKPHRNRNCSLSARTRRTFGVHDKTPDEGGEGQPASRAYAQCARSRARVSLRNERKPWNPELALLEQ